MHYDVSCLCGTFGNIIQNFSYIKTRSNVTFSISILIHFNSLDFLEWVFKMGVNTAKGELFGW